MESYLTKVQTRNSLEIAEFLGIHHHHLLRNIKKMEQVWEEVCQTKFGLAEYIDAQGKPRPCYNLTFEQTLFVTSKYNDKQRAILIKRWMELEKEQAQTSQSTPDDERYNTLRQKYLANYNDLRDDYRKLLDRQIKLLDEIQEVRYGKMSYMTLLNCALKVLPLTVTTSEIANLYGLTARKLNENLEKAGVINRHGGSTYIAEEYEDWNIVQNCRASNGENYLRWNQFGQIIISLIIDSEYNIPMSCYVLSMTGLINVARQAFNNN